MAVGDGFRLPCCQFTAASLGGARRDDDCRLQVDSLSERHETCCARLDNFDWLIPPCDLVGRLPMPEGDEDIIRH